MQTAPPSTWTVSPRNSDAEQRLTRELGVGNLLAQVLVARGLSETESARKFLNPSMDELHDPKLLPDYLPAKEVLLEAREQKLPIFVHGDYDVDGVTSAALLTRFLENIGCVVTTHVPHRQREGYGIHEMAVEYAHSAGAKVFLTCDCGTAANAQVQLAKFH